LYDLESRFFLNLGEDGNKMIFTEKTTDQVIINNNQYFRYNGQFELLDRNYCIKKLDVDETIFYGVIGLLNKEIKFFICEKSDQSTDDLTDCMFYDYLIGNPIVSFDVSLASKVCSIAKKSGEIDIYTLDNERPCV